jgi:hypothetical protein
METVREHDDDDDEHAAVDRLATMINSSQWSSVMM